MPVSGNSSRINPGRVEPLGGIGWRHPNVGHYQLGGLVANQRQQLRAVAGLPHDVETRAFEQAGQSLAEQDVVLGHDHAHQGGHEVVIFRRGRDCVARIDSIAKRVLPEATREAAR